MSVEIREYLKIFIDLIKVVAWPVFGLVVLSRFKDVIANVLGKSKQIVLKFAGVEINTTTEEASDALSGILGQIDEIVNDLLTPEEVQLFIKIHKHLGSPTVKDFFPDFDRTKSVNELKILRALRGVYFIRPTEGGTWQSDKHIEVTTFGNLVIRYRKELLNQKSTGTEPEVSAERKNDSDTGTKPSARSDSS